MSGKSNYLEDLFLNWEFKGVAMPSPPAARYVALFNGDPLDTGFGGTEVTTTIRLAGRVAGTFGTITTATGANTIANSAAVAFGLAAAGAVATHFATFDALTGGNMLRSGALSAGAQTISAGTDVTFAIGSLVGSED